MWLFYRLIFALYSVPKRLYRVFAFFLMPFYKREVGHSLYRSWALLIIDLTFFFDFYDIMSNLIKSNTRALTEEEIEKGRSVFGDSLNYKIIRLDTKAKIATIDKGIIYVGFNTINSWGEFRDDILIHELMHVWQYQNYGAGYIANALKAQISPAGYNYAYTEGWHLKSSIHDFNAEQQADLIQDYFRLRRGQKAQWKLAPFIQIAHYQRFIDEINIK
jgi:hypothetical protein